MAVLSPRDSTWSAALHTRQHLEAILERDHITVRVAAHLKFARADFEWPCTPRLLVSKLVAKPEVTGVLGHAAESVHGAVGVGRAVILQPLFY